MVIWKAYNLSLYTFTGQFIMAFQDDFYIINSNSYIKNIPTNLDKEFLKELFGHKKIKDELFKSHVQSLIEAKLLNPNKVKAWVNPF